MGKSKPMDEEINNSPGIPKVEKEDLKSLQCRFESDPGHQNTHVELGISMNHYADVYAVLDPLDQWCGSQGFPFTSRPTDLDMEKGIINILYVFEDTEHATLFALTFSNNAHILRMDIT